MWKIAVLKSNRHVVVIDRFLDHLAEQVARVGRETVCQALEQFCGEFELAFWDDLASRFDKSIEILCQVTSVRFFLFERLIVEVRGTDKTGLVTAPTGLRCRPRCLSHSPRSNSMMQASQRTYFKVIFVAPTSQTQDDIFVSTCVGFESAALRIHCNNFK